MRFFNARYCSLATPPYLRDRNLVVHLAEKATKRLGGDREQNEPEERSKIKLHKSKIKDQRTNQAGACAQLKMSSIFTVSANLLIDRLPVCSQNTIKIQQATFKKLHQISNHTTLTYQ